MFCLTYPITSEPESEVSVLLASPCGFQTIRPFPLNKNHYSSKMYTILINHDLSNYCTYLRTSLLLPLFPQKLPHSSSLPQLFSLFTVNSRSILMNHSICFSFPSSLHFPPLPPINSSTWSRAHCTPCAHQELSFKHFI